jgi:hypothetical protein
MESSEEVHSEVFFLGLWLGLLLLFSFLGFLLLLLVILLSSRGSGRCRRSDFAETFADDLDKE